MPIEIKGKDEFSGDLEISDKIKDHVKIGIGLFQEYLDYDLSKDQAFIVWQHLAKQFEFSESNIEPFDKE